MKRTKLSDRVLPQYTNGEEIFNMVSHIVGGALGIVMTILCVVIAFMGGDVYSIVSAFVYGFSLILLYTMSSIYHGLKAGIPKKVMQVLDHCTIFVLIAGTYTPYSLAAIRPIKPVTGWVIFGVVWAVAVVGIVLNAIDLKSFKRFSLICYIAQGWLIIVSLKTLIEAIGMEGFLYLLGGGIVYTIGAVLYAIAAKGANKHRYMHSVFHIFVVVASVLQFISVFFYALKW